MDPYFKRAKADEVVAILRTREPAWILIANGNKKDDRWHLQLAQRWVIQYNFYIQDHAGDGCSSVSVPTFPSRRASA